MNKQLTPLEALKGAKRIVKEYWRMGLLAPMYEADYNSCFPIIENALKEHEELAADCINMNYANGVLLEENKQLKEVLRIIKEKQVDVEMLISCIGYYLCDKERALFMYNSSGNRPLTQAEFDLLKEVLL